MNNRPLVYLFILITIIYCVLVAIIPPDPTALAKYHITVTHARILNLAIVIPAVLVWLTALYGLTRFRTFSHTVASTKEGPAFNQLARGMTVLAFSLPIGAAVSSVLSYAAINNTDLIPMATIIRNYIRLGFYIVAFTLIAFGAKELMATTKQKLLGHNMSPNILGPIIILLASFYTWMLIAKPLHSQETVNLYFLPNWLLVATIVIPYIFAWQQGILATYYLWQYRSKVKGKVYREAFKHIARGIAVIVGCSVLIQFLTTFSGRLGRLNLTPLFLLIYLLVILYALGFGLIAKGATKLKQIEEV